MTIAADKQIEIVISAADHASKVFESIKRSAGTLGNSFPSIAKSASSMAGSIAKSAAYAGVAIAGVATTAGYAASRLGKSMLESAGNIEQQRIALTTLTGSADEANKIVNQLVEDAKATPFEFSGLVRGNQMLISAGLSAEQARKDILNLGDAISATGGGQEEFNRIVMNLQQIQNVGQASAVDIKQFGFAGINIMNLLAESTGKTKAEIEDMVSAGTIGYKEISDALEKAAGSGGVYEDAMKNQSTTLFGLLSTFKDTVNLSFAEIAEKTGLFDSAKNALSSLITFFESNKQKIIDFAISIGETIQNTVIPALTDIGRAAVDAFNNFNGLVEKLNPFYENIKNIKGEMQGLQNQSDALGEKIKAAMESGADETTINNLVNQKAKIDENIESLKNQKSELEKSGSVYTQLKKKIEKFNDVLNEHKLLVIALAGAISGPLVAAFTAWAISAGIAAAETMLLIAPYALVGAAVATLAYLVITHWDQIKAKSKELWEYVVNGVQSFIQTLSAKMKQIEYWFHVTWKDIIVFLSGLSPQFYEIGMMILDGLKNGFMSKVADVKQAVMGSTKDIVAAAAAGAEVHSPSRSMMRIGKFMMEGLLVGLKSKKQELNDEMQSMVVDSSQKMAQQIVTDLDKLSQLQKQLSDEQSKEGDQRNQGTIDSLNNSIRIYKNYFDDNKYLLIKYGKEIADIRRKQGMTETEILAESLKQQENELKNSKAKEYLDAATSKVKEILQPLYDAMPEKKNIFEKFSDSFSKVKDFKSTLKDLKSQINEIKEDTKTTIQSIYSDFAAKLPSALAEITTDYNSKIAELSGSLGKDIASVLIEAEQKVSEYKDGLIEKQKEQANEILSLEKEQASKKKDIQKLLALNLTGNQKEALRTQLSELESSQAEEMAKLKAKQSSELSEIQSKIDEENAILSQHQNDYKEFADAITEARRVASLDAIDILREQFSQEKSEQATAMQDKIKALYSERDEAIKSAKEESASRISEIKVEIAKTNSLLEEEVSNKNKLFKKASEKIKDQLKDVLKYSKDFIGQLTDQFKSIPDSLSGAFSDFSDIFSSAANAVGAKKLGKKGKNFAKANNGGVVTSTGVMGFSDGGVVPGAMSLHDTVPAMLTPGEIVFNPRKGQGINQKVEVYFMNPTVRSENDMSNLVRIVEETLNRKLKLNNLGV